jgi:prolyl-tRNA editing enzyme YbaK/EbsC (Cys-tRNA(Pro) deacylase)
MALSASARKVQEVLQAYGLTCQVLELSATARSAREAAHAIGCSVEQIVKSLVFRSQQTHRPILVVASGGNRVNEQTLSALVAEPIEKADAAFVRQQTGFAIGGVPPVGHAQRLATFIDEDLLQYDQIWAAAGTPNAVFPLTPADLQRLTQGQVVSIT